MNESIYLIIILAFFIVVLSRFIVRMMKTGNKKYRIPVLYGRALLGFLLAMLFYIVYLILKGENVIGKLFG